MWRALRLSEGLICGTAVWRKHGLILFPELVWWDNLVWLMVVFFLQLTKMVRGDGLKLKNKFLAPGPAFR